MNIKKLYERATFARIIEKALKKVKKPASVKLLKKKLDVVEKSYAHCLYVWFN